MDKQGACVKLTSSIIIMIIGLSLTLCSKKPVFDKQHPPNILLIVLDAARADHFSSYGYHRPTTPNMDRMAGEGVRFTRAVSTSSWTLPSHASLFTGLLPDEHGTRNQHAWLIDRFPTLAELLQKHGYRTGCFTNNPIIDQYHNLVRGFEVLERIWADSAVISETKPHNSEHTNILMRSFLESGDERPFFAFINYMDVHQPYDAPEPYRSMYLDPGQQISARLDSACRYADLVVEGRIKLSREENEALAAIYDGCLTYLDGQVENLFQTLRSEGAYDSTLIIITSDHGQVFGEYGEYGHGEILNRPLIHIPLIVHYPGFLSEPKVRDDLISIVDIFHSLIEALDLQGVAPTGSPKRNIFSKRIMEAPCYSTFTLGRLPREKMKRRHDTHSVWTPEDRHYILRGDEAIECFDLAQDFVEQHNLCPEVVAPSEVVSVITGVRESHIEFVEDARDLRVSGDEIRIDPQMLRAMRALGYVDGGRTPAGFELPPHAQEHPHVMEHFKTGNFFFSLDSLSGAERELRKVVLMSPQNNDFRKKLGFTLFRNKKFEDAARTLQPIINTAEKDAEVSLILGLSFREMGKTDKAIEFFRKASDLEPGRLAAGMSAAELLMSRGRFDEAKVYAERVLAYNYGNFKVLLHIITIYLKNKNPEGAREILLKQLEKAQSGTIYALLSLVYRTMGQVTKADKCMNQASSLGFKQSRLKMLEERLNFAELKKLY